MTGKIILCMIAIILVWILFTPIRIWAEYASGELAVRIRYGAIKIQAYPFPEPKKKKPAKKKKPKKPKKPRKPKKPKPKFKINREQILYSLEKLPPILGRALKRTGRRIVITPLKVYLLIAGSDPADTAYLYGKITAALSAGLPVFHRLVRVEEQDIRLYPDFADGRMDCEADAGIAIRPWDLLVIGVCAVAGLIKFLVGFKKLASPPEEEPEGEQDEAGRNPDEAETSGNAA